MRAVRLMVALGLAGVLGGGALAAEGGGAKGTDGNPPWLGQWRTVTRDDATMTSTCFRDATEPVCAVDAFYACQVRIDRKTCRAMDRFDKSTGDDYYSFWRELRKGKYASDIYEVRYKIVSIKNYTGPESDHIIDEEYWIAGEVGDLIVQVAEDECRMYSDGGACGCSPIGDKSDCDLTELPKQFFLLRQFRGAWHYVASRSPTRW